MGFVGPNTLLEQGRKAAEGRSWRRAHEALTAARRAEPLAAQDLWLLALASYLVGDEEGFLDSLREAHQAFLEADDALEAVRAAFWIGQQLASRGELGRASGWFGRAARIVEEREAEGAAQGYALLPVGLKHFESGEHAASIETCAAAAEIGRRCRDGDLTALALHVQGRALLRLGRLEEGLGLLDEAMVAAAGGELSPVTTGLLYCSVISACREVYALRRAQEWTAALADWCEEQPEMIAYTGPCLVSRSEILQRRGEWSRAMEEAELALARFERGAGPGTAGPALYQKGELHRLRGEYAAAEDAYRAASRAGREPQPGLALLRMAQGEPEKAAASLRRGLAEAREPLRRARLLPAYVEVLLSLGDVEGALRACDDLDEVASAWPSRVLSALAAQARGSARLAGRDPEGALALLRRACEEWEALDAPYEAAKARMALAEACGALGDHEGAALELGGARDVFGRLGAAFGVAPAAASAGRAGSDHGLTPREREVLAWLATGRTNRAIAEALFISEKTVARHVANIYAKLGLSSRAAATAYAYQHDLLHPST